MTKPNPPNKLDVPSSVFSRGPARDARLTQPNSPWTLILGGAGLILLAGFVFTGLSHGRRPQAPVTTASSFRPEGMTFAAVQQQPAVMPTGEAVPVFGAPLSSGAQAPAPAMVQAPLSVVAAPDVSLTAPAVVVDLAGQPQGMAAPGGVGPALSPSSASAIQSADERFAARVTSSTAETSRARQMRSLSTVVPQGVMIPAVLTTAINSDLPGAVRAVVSRDVRSFDGAQVLIPRGSTLIGQYRSAAAVGQTRAFVIWSRLITPTGISVEIGSPATDRLGRGGLDGDTDTHFFRRFGAAIMLSVLSAGLDGLTRSDNASNNTLIIGSPMQANSVAQIALAKQIDIPVTIRVPQGQPVQVSLARDLDFSDVVASAR